MSAWQVSATSTTSSKTNQKDPRYKHRSFSCYRGGLDLLFIAATLLKCLEH